MIYRALLAALAILVSVTSANAQDAGVLAHAISLPPLHSMGKAKWWSDDAAVAGELPSAKHPRGTVLVVESADGQPAPTLSEWDLASGQQIRSVPLPLPLDLLMVSIVRAANCIHIVGYSRPHTDLFYLRLNSAWILESREVLGNVDRLDLETDGSIVAILWCGTREGAGDGYGWQLVTRDAAGNHLGEAFVGAADAFADGTPLAILERKIYVFPNHGGFIRPPIMRFAANARLEAAEPVSDTPELGASLIPWGGKLLMINGCGFMDIDPQSLRASWSIAVPYRPENGYPWCPEFGVRSNAAGRLVTSRGDVLSPPLKVERRFASQPKAGYMPFWIGSTPALLMFDVQTGRTWIEWSE